MNESNMNSSSKTNWERLDTLTEEDIDTSDSPALTEEFFAKAQWLMPGQSASAKTPSASAAAPGEKVKVELEMDSNILAWFQSQGQDYKHHMRAALRLYAEAHQTAV